MDQALRLAARAVGRTRPNPVVGCVIVADNRVVGRGFHPKAGEPHAEVFALRDAGQKAKGATAYVTLEPCSHTGRTPPCAQGLIKAGVSRVVVAMTDPNPKVSGAGLQMLQSAGIEVATGVREEEAKSLIKPFTTWVKHGRPMLTLKMAASLDGKTATRSGESQWITGPYARKYVQGMRDRHDVVLVGIGTVLADDPRLNCRIAGGRDPIRLVVDSNLQIPHSATIYESSDSAPLWIATLEKNSGQTVERLSQRGVKVIKCKETSDGRVDLVHMMQQLGELEITSVLSEAGGILSDGLLNAGVVDRLALFLAPKLIGGHEAPGLLKGLGVAELAKAQKISNLKVTTIGDDLLIRGDII
ncbi:MAG: bifunctional diaminohydroxyphosphoribosylaminopyrimidine deaminase/5-amino-6-(5-phosphoribosylamino)uracil reductase RibD [Magnetococcales bacterium]|nr:bifunctional diaminohydroxyphosphoribosylaminopyrimidine deaminase/5-amino-6-(5-phosphoribosylamino)uracil reductase RibD [Magnetococcales bacterium]